MNMDLDFPEPIRDPVTHDTIEAGGREPQPVLHEALTDGGLPGPVTGALSGAFTGALVGGVVGGPPGAVIAGALGSIGGAAFGAVSERRS